MMGQMNVRLMLRSIPKELMIKKRRKFNMPSKNDDEHDNNFKIKHFFSIEKRNKKREKEIKHLLFFFSAVISHWLAKATNDQDLICIYLS